MYIKYLSTYYTHIVCKSLPRCTHIWIKCIHPTLHEEWATNTHARRPPCCFEGFLNGTKREQQLANHFPKDILSFWEGHVWLRPFSFKLLFLGRGIRPLLLLLLLLLGFLALLKTFKDGHEVTIPGLSKRISSSMVTWREYLQQLAEKATFFAKKNSRRRGSKSLSGRQWTSSCFPPFSCLALLGQSWEEPLRSSLADICKTQCMQRLKMRSLKS